MKYILDHDYHIHSMISQCSSDPEQSTENILKAAKARGLKQIVLTDHFWDENVPGASNWYEAYHKFSDIKKALPLPKCEGVEFLFGCETDMDKNGVIGISKERLADFDFIIVPTTHMHMKGFTVEEDDYCNPERLNKLWVERFDALLNADLPFYKVGIAHLTTVCIAVNDRLHVKVIEMIPDEEMYRLFKKAAKLGLGIEINGSDFNCTDEELKILLHPYEIAKECGCKFYYGSDAHKPREFVADKNFDKVREYLGLTEDDKFVIAPSSPAKQLN